MAHRGVFAPLRASTRIARLRIEPPAANAGADADDAPSPVPDPSSDRTAPEVPVAANSLRRLRGLLLSRETALLIVPCSSVHGIGMTQPLETAYLAEDGTVLRTAALRPWHAHGLVRDSVAVLEAAPGSFERWGITVGARVVPEPIPALGAQA
ncbi:MAG: DUF192 domain-containing protein [Brevibacterium yomogidense]|uniref:DUF192 domain-containing protein n=1 Tax=Brevibacterium sp. Mu109 TaxID=1255669 RepID=UPI000C5087AE|nr:DUF192 domain-containing protein [Brevibacterium sp. Mu109]SMX74134.1 Uncharacterized ACR, COG1430 [Brevibacterium sp. Mu109]